MHRVWSALCPSRASNKSRLRHRFGNFQAHAEALQPYRERPAKSRRWPVSINRQTMAERRYIFR
jgi:hypothetical protein